MPTFLKLATLLGTLTAGPSSSLVMSVEDELAAGGGGGTPAADTSPTAPAAPAPQPDASERRFTQTDVDRIVQERIARERDKGARQSSAPAAANGSGLTMAQRLDLLESENTFYRGVQGAGVTLTGEQSSDLLQLYRAQAQKPDDVAGWIARKAETFGIGAKPQLTAATPAPTSTTTPAAPAAAPAPQSPAPAAAAAGATPNGTTFAPGAIVDVSKLSSAERAQLGPAGIRAALEATIAAGQGRDGRPALPGALRTRKA